MQGCWNPHFRPLVCLIHTLCWFSRKKKRQKKTRMSNYFKISASCSPPRYLLPSPPLHWANQGKTEESLLGFPILFSLFSSFPPTLFFSSSGTTKNLHIQSNDNVSPAGITLTKKPCKYVTGHIQSISRVPCLQSSPRIFEELISPWCQAEGGDPADPEDGMSPEPLTLSLCHCGSSLTLHEMSGRGWL